LLQVARSVEYVQSGTTALADAKMLQKKTRKWMCCAIILLLVTAAVIVIVVSVSSSASSSVLYFLGWHFCVQYGTGSATSAAASNRCTVSMLLIALTAVIRPKQLQPWLYDTQRCSAAMLVRETT
jgi:hypothetical protein